MAVELVLPDPFQHAGERFSFATFGAADLPAIFAIEERSHRYPWRLENFRSSLDSHVCIGLRRGEEWVAYGILSFVVGEAEILLFVVDKAWQGKGVGSRFLAALLKAAAQKAETVFLEVRESNQPAIALYESVGFNQVGLRPNYYPAAQGRREDALLYALDLRYL
ncbi:ribosomal-protein-alanine N-acetyltransferase [Saccharophagus sp. K07]|jgi:ribosomal-protein-alanine N-acetyltransferase|uniref:ribosomal protein S18-alanine N-acetyltransferase n=1 Tax=Saccharophagus sp. K07 TaxID=2283636 RepID=UPI001651DABD|nr:ribosomal protein S18-alanine N-acetyltransferase [Saccharophagus sp. K07]MBC6907052.1 ribosomal-protein-alanine N-acetyltransferase [Saccharophagus sp. K07]